MKNIFLIAIIILIATFIGCAETGNGVDTARTNDIEIDRDTNSDDFIQGAFENIVTCDRREPVTIITEDSDIGFTEKFMNYFSRMESISSDVTKIEDIVEEISRAISGESEVSTRNNTIESMSREYGFSGTDELLKKIEEKDEFYLSSYHKILGIPSFYSLDNFKINSYQLYQVNMYETYFSFKFVPINELGKDGLTSVGLNNISISIYRQEIYDEANVSDPFSESAENALEQGWGYLTKDNMIYASRHNEVTAQLGNTFFRIIVPGYLNTYEYLRDLAFQVIETAELVNVAEARAAMAQR